MWIFNEILCEKDSEIKENFCKKQLERNKRKEVFRGLGSKVLQQSRENGIYRKFFFLYFLPQQHPPPPPPSSVTWLEQWRRLIGGWLSSRPQAVFLRGPSLLFAPSIIHFFYITNWWFLLIAIVFLRHRQSLPVLGLTSFLYYFFPSFYRLSRHSQSNHSWWKVYLFMVRVFVIFDFGESFVSSGLPMLPRSRRNIQKV